MSSYQPSFGIGGEFNASIQGEQAYHTTEPSMKMAQQDLNASYDGGTAASTAGARNAFTKNYKEITFDTLKERHDNFSFEKVLRSKNQIHDTMHFQGIREHNPAMMLINR